MLDTMALTRAFLRNQTDNGAVKSVTGLLSWPKLDLLCYQPKTTGNPKETRYYAASSGSVRRLAY